MSDLALTSAGRIDRRSPPEAQLRQAARQFEAMFVRELMRPLENSDGEDNGLFEDSNASQQFRGMFHGAVAEQAAGGIGVADTLVRALALRPGSPSAKATP
jgi:flagellar protein FlgJ